MRAAIGDLKPGMDNLTVIGKVTNKSLIVEIRMKKYASVIIEDKTGRIKLNLWRQQVSQAEKGDVIRVLQGFVHVRSNVVQLSSWVDIEKGTDEDLEEL